MASKRPIHSDIFGESKKDNDKTKWLSKCRKAQWSLEKVKNPYVGNKRKLIVDLGAVLFEEGLSDIVDGGNVLDLFAGSGFVSYFFKYMGACVWANDILASSYLNVKTLIEAQHDGMINHIESSLDMILEDLVPSSTFVLDNYCPDRFSKEEAIRIDSIRENADKHFGHILKDLSLSRSGPDNFKFGNYFGKEVSDIKKEYNPYIHSHIAVTSIMHYIMNCCFVGGRLNSGQILAKFDHRVAHQRNNGNEMTFAASAIPLYDISVVGKRVCRATRSDAIDLLRSDNELTQNALKSLDIVYIDPPYGGDQSDYTAMYNFMEDFMFYGDNSKNDIIDSKRFAGSKTYKENFVELLESLPEQAIWIFSYNDSSWADIDGIVDPIKKIRSNITVREIDYKYHYRKDRSSGTEYVIIVRPENK